MRAGTRLISSKDRRAGRSSYLEVPNGHCPVDARGAELTTIPFVSLIDRHLAKKTWTRNCRGAEKWDELLV